MSIETTVLDWMGNLVPPEFYPSFREKKLSMVMEQMNRISGSLICRGIPFTVWHEQEIPGEIDWYHQIVSAFSEYTWGNDNEADDSDDSDASDNEEEVDDDIDDDIFGSLEELWN